MNRFLALFFIYFFAIPLVVIPQLSVPFEFPKFLLFIIGIPIFFCLYLFLLRKEISLTDSLLAKLILAFLLLVGLSDVLGLDMRTSLLGSPYRFQGYILLLTGFYTYLLMANAQIKETESILQKILQIFLVLITTFAVGQFVFIHFLHISLSTYDNRIVGTFGEPTFLAAYLVTSLPLLYNSKKQALSLFWVLTFCIGLVVLITSSRSALLAYVIICACFLWKSQMTTRMKALLTLCSVVLLTAFCYFFHPNLLRFSQWDNQLIVWKDVYAPLSHLPSLGYGQENLQLVFPSHFFFAVDNAHNIFLETLLASGIGGFLLLLAILYFALRNATFSVRLSLIAFLITAQFSPLSVSSYVLFWFLVGLSARPRANK